MCYNGVSPNCIASLDSEPCISVAKISSGPLDRNFWLPLSTQASSQLPVLQNLINGVQRQDTKNDLWSYIVGGNPIFTSKKSLRAVKGTQPASPLFALLWQSQVQNKTKFFFWLFLRDRLNTRNLLRRKNMYFESYSCVLCVEDEEETRQHLFFDCRFSQAWWIYLGIQWDTSLQRLERFFQAKQNFECIQRSCDHSVLHTMES